MLDLTLTVENGEIWSKTFQKALNLYLYLPPSSAHPPACFKGLIFGELGRFWRQCSRKQDFVRLTTLFFVRLKARGHRGADLVHMFRQAAVHLVRREVSTPGIPEGDPGKGNSLDDTLFLHIDYHPRGIQRRAIRSLYDRHLRGNLPASFKNMVVAVSRPQNIRNACVSNTFECEDIANMVSDAWGPGPQWV